MHPDTTFKSEFLLSRLFQQLHARLGAAGETPFVMMWLNNARAEAQPMIRFWINETPDYLTPFFLRLPEGVLHVD